MSIPGTPTSTPTFWARKDTPIFTFKLVSQIDSFLTVSDTFLCALVRLLILSYKIIFFEKSVLKGDEWNLELSVIQKMIRNQ